MRLEAYLHRNRHGDRIAVLFRDGNPEVAQLISKEVSTSRRFSKADALPSSAPADPPIAHAAHYPLTVDKCREMRGAWGDALKVHGHLAAWYRQAVKEHTAHTAITTLSDVELPVLAKAYPAFNTYLAGDQRVTAKWIAGAYRHGGLLADEVGTGKTVGVVAGLIERRVQGNILIVCPKISVKAVWWKEISKHTDIPVYAAKGNRAQREKVLAAYLADPAPQKVLVIVAEMLRIKAIRDKGRVEQFLGYEYPVLFEEEWDAIVVDESHKMLGAMDVVRANLAGEGLRALSAAPGRLKLAVSATPFGKGGRVEALFGTLHWLWPDEYTSRWAWLARHFEISEERVFIKGGGGSSKMVKKVGGLKQGHSEEAFWAELGPRVLRRTMEEVSPKHRGLKNYVEVLCELEGKQATNYRKFSDDAELAVDGGVITTVGTLDFLTRARQFANGVLRMEGGRVKYTGESAKLDRMMDHLDKLEPGRKLVISSQYNEFLDVVCDRLREQGLGWYRLDGKTTERERERIMNEFQGDELFYGPGVTCPKCNTGKGHKHGVRCVRSRPTIFLLNSQAGGVSITLDAAEEMHQLDEMYPPEANTQLYGRIFRRGRAHEVFFYLYRAMGTIDEAIAENVAAGGEAQLRLLDGRRGKEYVRQLAKYNPEGK